MSAAGAAGGAASESGGRPPARAPLFVSHLATADGSTRRLSPWIVHVFQGKPAHQSDEPVEASGPPEFCSSHPVVGPADESSASSVSLSLPLVSSSLSSSSPTVLPFSAPTSKGGHDEHDMRALSPEQSAYYANEYGKVEQQLEIAGVLDALRYRDDEGRDQRVCQRVVFHQVSVANVDRLIGALQRAQAELDRQREDADQTTRTSIPTLVVMNLCDGTEVDGYPGVTIATALAQTCVSPTRSLPALRHTGADPDFFDTTTDKVTMKKLFHASGVRTSAFVDLSSIPTEALSDDDLLAACPALLAALTRLTFPVIIKPTSSYSSCGLTSKSVVGGPLAALKQAQVIRRELGAVLAEEFVQGREFSMLLVGDAEATDTPPAASPAAPPAYSHLRCYTACERAFAPSLPPLEQFLTFEQNYPTRHTKVATWWQPLDQGRTPEEAARAQAQLADLACSAYTACRGRSYGRVDLRQSSSSGEYFLLEVNSLPGLSGELDSSVGAILAHTRTQTHFGEFLYAILHLAAEGRLDRPRAPADR